MPAAVTIAQAIEESAWGNSQLAAEYHNLFGIKGSGPAGSVGLPTSEFYNGQWVTIDGQFRVYHNVAESIADHAELLATSGYYQRAMADRAIPDAFANDLTGVYATDPDYGANLIAIMKLYNLYRFDGPVQSVPSVQPQSAQASATPAPATSRTRPRPRHRPRLPQPTQSAADGSALDPADQAAGGQATIPGLGAPALAPATTSAGSGAGSAAAHQPAAQIPGVVAPTAASAGSSTATPAAAARRGSGRRRLRLRRRLRPRRRLRRRRQLRERRRLPPRPRRPPSRRLRLRPPARPRAGRRSPGWPLPRPTTSASPPPPRRTAARYQPQFTTAVTTAYFATAKGPVGHGEHLYRDVAAQTGIRWELLAACDWMQCKAHPRYSPVHGEKIGALNSDGTSYATKSAALGQCARDLIELAAAVYGIDLTARRLLSVRALADAFAAFRWGALLVRHGVSAMEFPYSVAGLTAQHQKMHWPVIDDPAAPDRPGARFREPFGAVPGRAQPRLPGNRLNGQKAQATPCSGSFPGSDAGPTSPLAPRPLPPVSR